MPRPKPMARLKGYRGPYPRYMLEEARDALMKTMDRQDTVIWKRIRQKTGIFENGERDDMFLGWGESSYIFSHADFHSKPFTPGIASVSEDAGPSGQSTQTYSSSDREPFQGTNSKQDLRSQSKIPPQLKGSHQSEDTSFPTRGTQVGKTETLTSPDDVLDADLTSSIELPQLNTSSCIDPIEQTYTIPSANVNRRRVSEHKEVSAKKTSRETIKITIDISDEGSNDSKKEAPVIEIGDETDDLLLSRDGLEVLAESKSFSGNDSDVQIVDSPGSKKDVIDVDKTDDELIIVVPNETSVDDSAGVREVKKKKSEFICDFCPFVTSSKKIVTNHLKSEVHYSASEHFVEAKSGVKYVKEKMAVTNQEALFKKVVAICPSCPLVFSSSYECGYHYQQVHHHYAKPMYAVAKVVEIENIEVPCEPVSCNHCDFKSLKIKLHKHFVSENHFPFKTLENCTQSFLCTSCYSVFCTYELMCKHQELEHMDVHKDGMFTLRVLHLGQKNCRRLPETTNIKKISQKRELDVIVDEAASFENKRKKKAEEECMNGSGDEPAAKALVIDDQFFIDRQPSQIVDLAEDRNETILKQDPSTALVNVKYDSHDTHTNQNLQDMIKCDYCDTLHKSIQSMQEHLTSSRHSSASSVQVNSNGQTQVIRKKMTVMSTSGVSSNTVAVCPEDDCTFIFESIYSCVEHYQSVHEPNGERYYGIANVAETLTVDLSQLLQNMQCTVCGRCFKNLKKLHSHMRKFPAHLPYEQKPGTRTHLICITCDKVWKCRQMINHIANKLKFGARHLVKVVYIENEKKIMKLQPFTANIEGRRQAIISKIDYLKESLKKENVGRLRKSIKKAIQHEQQYFDRI